MEATCSDFHFSLDEDTQFTQILNTQGLVYQLWLDARLLAVAVSAQGYCTVRKINTSMCESLLLWGFVANPCNQQVLHALMCSFLSTIPERKEQLLVVYPLV